MNILTVTALFFLLAVGLVLAAAAAFRTVRRDLGRRRGVFAALAALAAACTILAQKTSISFDRLISDAGSYATNDVLHVAATNAGAYAAFDFSSSDLLVYRRERGLTNAADWVECLPRRKYGDQPADWHVPDATNYDYLIAVDYVPPSPVHTNGVFELRGFAVPSAAAGTRSAAFATSSAQILPPTARDYVQDGLIAMWDGIENAGWGVHNPNATEWKDLIGGGGDLPVITSQSLYFSSDALVAIGGKYAGFGDIPQVALSGDFTYEVCWSRDTKFIESADSRNEFGLLRIDVFRGKLFVISSPNNRCDYTPPINVREGVRFTQSMVGQYGASSASALVYCNGIPLSNGVLASGNYNNTRIAYGSGWSEPSSHHCNIRLYSRTLTAEEITRNYRIDKERFNLP